MMQSQSVMGRVKHSFGVAVAATLMSSLAVVGLSSSAGASVARYQVQTMQYTVTVQGGYVHSYTVTTNPCDNTFTGTGQYPATGPAQYYETLFGSSDSFGNLTYTAFYFDPTTGNPTNYQYTFTGSFTDDFGSISGTMSDNGGNVGLTVTGVMTSSTSDFANHGQYVAYMAALGQANDAAHSCVGMPIQSRSQE